MDIHSVPEQMQKVMTALQKGNKAEAREILDELIKKHPNDERLWLWMSWTMESREEFEHCIEQIRRINPDHPTIKRRQEDNSSDSIFSSFNTNLTEQSLLLKRARSSSTSSSQSVEDAPSSEEPKVPNEIQEILALYEKPVHMVEENTVIPISHIMASYPTGASTSEATPASSDAADTSETNGEASGAQTQNMPAEGTESTVTSEHSATSTPQTETTSPAIPDSTAVPAPDAPTQAEHPPKQQDPPSSATPAELAAATVVGAVVAAQTNTTSPTTPETPAAQEGTTSTTPEATTTPEIPAAPATPETTTTTKAATSPPQETTTSATPDVATPAASESTAVQESTTAPEATTSAETTASTPATAGTTTPATPDVAMHAASETNPPSTPTTTTATSDAAATSASTTQETSKQAQNDSTSSAIPAALAETSAIGAVAAAQTETTTPTTAEATATPAAPEATATNTTASTPVTSEASTPATPEATTPAKDSVATPETSTSTPDTKTQGQTESPPTPSNNTGTLSATALAASAATVAASVMSAENTVPPPESNVAPANTVSPSAPTQIALSSPDAAPDVQDVPHATNASTSAANATTVEAAPLSSPASAEPLPIDSASHSAPTVVALPPHPDVKDILAAYSTSDDQQPVPDNQAKQPYIRPSSRTSPYKEEGEDYEKYIFELTLTMPDRDDLKQLLQQKVLLAIVFVIIVLTLIFSIQFLINRQKPGNTTMSSAYPRSTQIDHVSWNVLKVEALDNVNNETQNPATRFVELYLNVQNVGTSTLHMESLLFTDEDEVMTYQPVTTHPFFVTIPEENICDQKDIITPDEILVCRSIFEIPRDAGEMKLRISNLITENHKINVLSLRMPPPTNGE